MNVENSFVRTPIHPIFGIFPIIQPEIPFGIDNLLYLYLNMTLGNKTTFGRACGAGSKIVFSDLLFKAPNTQNTPFYFRGSKNNPQAEFCQPWASEACLNANLPPPPPPNFL